MPAQVATTRIGVVVITTADGLEQDWIKQLQADSSIEVLARVGVLSQGVTAVQQHQPTTVVIDRPLPEISEALPQIEAVAPNALSLAVLPQQDMVAFRRLVTSGVRDILTKPLRPGEIVTSIQRAVHAEEERRQRAHLPSLLAARAVATAGKVVVVMGPKGGVGSTTIATNLAVALHEVSGQDVVLADFSLQFGDAAALLNVYSKHTVQDLAAHYDEIDDTLLDNVLVKHDTGIKVLQAPAEPEAAADIGAAQVEGIIAALRARFGYVVIDCWSFADEITLALIGASDQTLIVTTPEVPALKNTRLALDYFLRHAVRRDRIALVLNRFPSVKGVTIKDIQEHIGFPIQANLPSDGAAVTYAGNKGVPVVRTHPESWVAQSFFKLAAWLAGDNVSTISTAPSKDKVRKAKPAAAPSSRRWIRLRGSSR